MMEYSNILIMKTLERQIITNVRNKVWNKLNCHSSVLSKIIIVIKQSVKDVCIEPIKDSTKELTFNYFNQIGKPTLTKIKKIYDQI